MREYHYDKFRGVWTTNKGETQGAICLPSPQAYILPKQPSLNRAKDKISFSREADFGHFLVINELLEESDAG